MTHTSSSMADTVQPPPPPVTDAEWHPDECVYLEELVGRQGASDWAALAELMSARFSSRSYTPASVAKQWAIMYSPRAAVMPLSASAAEPGRALAMASPYQQAAKRLQLPLKSKSPKKRLFTIRNVPPTMVSDPLDHHSRAQRASAGSQSSSSSSGSVPCSNDAPAITLPADAPPTLQHTAPPDPQAAAAAGLDQLSFPPVQQRIFEPSQPPHRVGGQHHPQPRRQQQRRHSIEWYTDEIESLQQLVSKFGRNWIPVARGLQQQYRTRGRVFQAGDCEWQWRRVRRGHARPLSPLETVLVRYEDVLASVIVYKMDWDEIGAYWRHRFGSQFNVIQLRSQYEQAVQSLYNACVKVEDGDLPGSNPTPETVMPVTEPVDDNVDLVIMDQAAPIIQELEVDERQLDAVAEQMPSAEALTDLVPDLSDDEIVRRLIAANYRAVTNYSIPDDDNDLAYCSD